MSHNLEIGLVANLEPTPDTAITAARLHGASVVEVPYPPSLDNDIGVASIKASLQTHGIRIASSICRFEGESFANLASARATVGLSPETTRAARLDFVTQVAAFGERVGVSRIQVSLGNIPTDVRGKPYQDLLATARAVCHIAAKYRQSFAIETAIAAPTALRRFINEVRRPNLRVTFAPASFVVLDVGNPLEAVDLLLPFIDMMDCRDGVRPTSPGQLGTFSAPGSGQARVLDCLGKLRGAGFKGSLLVGATDDDTGAIKAAKAVLASSAYVKS